MPQNVALSGTALFAMTKQYSGAGLKPVLPQLKNNTCINEKKYSIISIAHSHGHSFSKARIFLKILPEQSVKLGK